MFDIPLGIEYSAMSTECIPARNLLELVPPAIHDWQLVFTVWPKVDLDWFALFCMSSAHQTFSMWPKVGRARRTPHLVSICFPTLEGDISRWHSWGTYLAFGVPPPRSWSRALQAKLEIPANLPATLLFVFLNWCSCSHTFWKRVLCNVNGMHSSQKLTWIGLAFGAPKTCERVVVERWKQQRSHEKPCDCWVFGEQINGGSALNILWIASVRKLLARGVYGVLYEVLLQTSPNLPLNGFWNESKLPRLLYKCASHKV